MNLLHMKHAVEVAKAGSLGKASEALLIAVPNISRSIKELETDLGIIIFERTSKGMILTPEGEEFINFAKDILAQIDQVDKYYKENTAKKEDTQKRAADAALFLLPLKIRNEDAVCSFCFLGEALQIV